MATHKIGNLKVKELVKLCNEKDACKECIIARQLEPGEYCTIKHLKNYLEFRVEIKEGK